MTAAPPGDPARASEDMSIALSAGHYDSFVVRVFSRGRERTPLHGEVTHVATRRTQRFTDLSTALAFMIEVIGQDHSLVESPDHD